jgi:putative adhesin
MIHKVVFAILMATSISLFAQEKTINKSFNNIEKIVFNISSGDCQFVKGDDDKVSVRLVYSYDDEDYKPIFKQDGSTLTIKEKFSNNKSSRGDSDWQLSIPDGLEIYFNAGSGDLEINDIAVTVKSNTGSGDVNFSNLTGAVDLNSGSGEVNMDYFKGNLNINTGSGDVDLSNSEGSFKINLGSGTIDVNKLSGELNMNVGSGDIDANNMALTGASNFNSGSGDVKVILKSALKNDISVNSGSGDATLDFNGLDIEGEIIMKANKRRGEISAPFKFDNVTEEKSGNQTIVKKTAIIGSSKVKIKVTTGSGRAAIEK